MNIFKSTTLTWWQLGLLKWAVLAIGIAVGAEWAEVFTPYTLVLVVAGLVVSLYLALVWAKHK